MKRWEICFALLHLVSGSFSLITDIMKVGGYKLSAFEIESMILQHLSVIECCVLGLPDKDQGERVCAIIVLQPNTKMTMPDESKPTMSLHELPTWAKDKLAPYKLPTMLLLKDLPPQNAMGKVNCFSFLHSV
ncbi:unnamed protein product [Citrullus colocynthis]|uniref:AMP-binding enzyme C-terminal domain-containing protein n=1 Tax=Citrullus colocynthis TaxID=252529 RepID=A0ABP0XQQ2_9ROSI